MGGPSLFGRPDGMQAIKRAPYSSALVAGQDGYRSWADKSKVVKQGIELMQGVPRRFV